MILNFLFFKYNGQHDVYMAKDWAVICKFENQVFGSNSSYHSM